jgi:hypothetical protein
MACQVLSSIEQAKNTAEAENRSENNKGRRILIIGTDEL